MLDAIGTYGQHFFSHFSQLLTYQLIVSAEITLVSHGYPKIMTMTP